MAKRVGTKRRVAFISGLDAGGYGIVRSLGREGIGIAALTSGVNDFARFSRYCHQYDLYPAHPEQPRSRFFAFVPDEEAICQLLRRWGSRFDQKPVLFATSDWFAAILANYQRDLASHYLFHWIPRDLVFTILDKARMADFCHQAGVLIQIGRAHV